jgi:hypothetical protein
MKAHMRILSKSFNEIKISKSNLLARVPFTRNRQFCGGKRGFLAIFGGIPSNLDGLLSFGFPIPTETSAKLA